MRPSWLRSQPWEEEEEEGGRSDDKGRKEEVHGAEWSHRPVRLILRLGFSMHRIAKIIFCGCY